MSRSHHKGMSDTIAEVPPATTTTTTTPGLLGSIIGGSTTTTTGPAAPLAAPPPPPQKDTATVVSETMFSVFFRVLTVAMGAAALYLVARMTGMNVPTWILLVLSLVPFVPLISIMILAVVTVFYGIPNQDEITGVTLLSLFTTVQKT